jgi:tellurite methyltransferase
VGKGDRERWNASWSDRGEAVAAPAAFLVEHEALLPRRGRALDVAGGAGRHAVWLARRGLEVTLVDVSDRALELAAATGVELRLLRLDLDREELPAELFDVVVCFHFLDRANRDGYVSRLADGGLLVIAQPTMVNLERHPRPSARFLLERGELEGWACATGLEIVVSREGWNVEGRHEAELIARR